MEAAYQELESEATRWLDFESVPDDRRELTRSADLRYAHQGFEVTVGVTGNVLDPSALDATMQQFHREHTTASSASLLTSRWSSSPCG